MTTYRGEDMIGDNGYGTEESIHKHTPGPETNVRKCTFEEAWAAWDGVE